MMSTMRTTLQLDDEVYRAARSLAASHNKSLGRIVSDLARKGLAARSRIRYEDGFPVFDVPSDSPPITPEMIREALDEE